MSNEIKNKLLSVDNTEEQIEKSTSEVSTSEVSTSQSIGNLYGDALNDDNINDIINSIVPELIVLVGFAGYGKSTLVGSMYHYFRRDGRFCEYSIADSDTFAGFERRTFLRSIHTTMPAVKRTLRGDDYYLTLDLVSPHNRKRKIIISDKAGEVYQSYVSDNTKLLTDNGLKRADRVVFFIDSEKLISREQISMADSLNELFTRIQTNDILKSNAIIYLVYTKRDLIEESLNEKYISKKQDVQKQIEEQLQGFEINSFEINAKSVKQEDDYSIVPLFKSLFDIEKGESMHDTHQLDWVQSLLNNTTNHGK